MNVEHLISLANAHGVDLKGAAGAATETEGIARKRERTRLEVKLGIEVKETASGRQTWTYRRPAYSLAELAQASAAGGVGYQCWLALRYSLMGDVSCVDELQGILFGQAMLIGRRECWPAQVVGLNGEPKFYREELSQLVLDADAHQHYFAASPALHAICMGVSAETWSRSLQSQFATLKDRYSTWIAIGCAAIRRGLRGCD